MLLLDFTRIKMYYDRGFWTKEMVWTSVSFNKITKEDYKVITGDEYTDVFPKGE